ncbi:phage tail protein [Stenotrophomonas maltophilia]|uniref:phage tail protein n=1 Tax=Stenotrophomonas maltophilia TaxID=40324 RepID=UPI001F538EEE|nr:phage tail protein [Stenotrophomonas maltophilia]
MRMKITTAGRAKLVNASNTGTNTVLISHIGLTATGFTPTTAMTQLPGEFKRMTTFGGKSVAADTIHVTLQDSGTEKYTLRGFGLYLSDGTLFAVYGQSEAIMEKATISTLLLSADVVFADIDTAQIKFGSTEFLNPPATETVPGVVELADGTETTNGTDAVRAVTPRGLKTALNNRFGGDAPTPFVKTLLSLATAAAIRTALEVKGAALKDMGHGKGLDADTLDGMHASDFPQVGKVQPIDAIPGNSNQVRWIKLGTLPWRGAAASILLLEMTNGAIGSPRYAWEQIATSTRTFDATTALTQAIVDGMVQHTRIGADSSLDRPSRFGLVLTTDAAGKSTGVELWLQQREYNQGHAVRVVNAAGTTYHGPGTFVTAEPQGIIYATVQPLAYMGDLRRLVEATENRWGRRQTFALGLYLPSDQTVDLGFGGGSLRGTDTGSVVLAAGAGPTGESGGYVYLRPNGSANPAGQLAVYKNGFTEMAGARIGTGSGEGKVLCELYSERPWQFKQGGTEGNTALELHDITGGKEFRLTNVANDRRIILNPTGGWVYAAEFKGKLTGNADTASKFAAPRTINGTSFDGSANIVTTSWGAYRKVTIGNTAKTLNGGADFSWSLAEIGAASLAHQHALGDVQGLPQALDGKGDNLGPIQYKTYDEHIAQTAFAAAFHSATEAPSDAPLKAQHNVLHFGSHWGRAQIAIPNDFDRLFFRTGTRTAWQEAWHTGNFKPADKLDRAGGIMTGIVQFETASALRFKSATPTYFQGPDGAGDNVINFTRNGKSDYTVNVFGSLTVGGERAWHTGNFVPSTKANRIPGQVIMFAGKTAPSGTLLCDGAAVSRTTYAELFAAIGTLYGAGDGKTTFNLPAMLEGTVVTHTQKPETVGTATNGEVIRHAHGASSASAGTHSHTITVAGGGAHSHGASAAAAGDHAHNTWTDSQGHHAHTGGTSASGDHQHISPFGDQMPYPWGQHGNRDQVGTRASGVDQDNSWPLTNPAGNHAHTFTTDGAGAHAHNIGMNNAGNHTHTISVAQVGDHGHSASAADAGAHTHAVTVNSTGGDRNLPAGLRMIYCITY